MDEFPLFKNMMLLASGIDACIEKKAITPALVLIYSAIDTTGCARLATPHERKRHEE